MIALWVDIKETICLEGQLLTGLANIRGIIVGRISGVSCMEFYGMKAG